MTDEDETVNQANALWVRSKSDISDEQYKEFYKHVAHDFEDPLAWTHARVEGKQEYTQLLYIPARAPFDLWDRNARHGIKLYVRRVFIMDDAEQLMPLYMRFVRGVVDSSDLPLNVSREILQQSKDIDGIRSGCTRKVLGMLEDLAENDKEKYAKFWEAFGSVLKEGVGEDFANKEKIAGLIRFASTHNDTPEQTVSLADYIGRMKEGQEKIYFVTAETFNAAKNSPHLEIFRKKGIEVLLLSDRVDEWVVGHLTEFDGKQLQSVAKGGLDLGKLEDEAEKKEAEKAADEYKELLDKVKTSLGDKVKDVRVTYRLTDSPSCLVSDEHDPSGNLARLMKAAGQPMPDTQADPRNQPAAPGGDAPEVRGKPLRRLGGAALRTGDPGRRRPARRPGRLRQAHQRPDDGPVRQVSRDCPAGPLVAPQGYFLRGAVDRFRRAKIKFSSRVAERNVHDRPVLPAAPRRHRIAQPGRHVVADAQSCRRRQCADRPDGRVLPPARFRRPDPDRGLAGLPGRPRLPAHAGHPYGGADRRLEEGDRRRACGGRADRHPALACRADLASGPAAGRRGAGGAFGAAAGRPDDHAHGHAGLRDAARAGNC